MSNELRAAAERLVLSGETCGGVGEPYYKTDHNLNFDLIAVGDAYLSEHPADDDEPVSEEWWVKIGLKVDDLSWHGNGPELAYLVTQNHPEAGEYAKYGVKRAACDQTWGLYLLPGADGFDGREDYLTDVATRGEFRGLYKALKIHLTEPSHATGG